MTPDQFSHNTSAWLSALSSLLVPLTAFVGGIFGFIAYAKARLNEIRINGHSKTLDTVLLNTQAPGSNASVNVNAGPPSDVTINTTETPTPPYTTVVPFIPPTVPPPGGTPR